MYQANTTDGDDLLTPEGFDRAVRRRLPTSVHSAQKPQYWAERFEDLMLQLANDSEQDLRCQNLRTAGEWMNVDHVFVSENRYDAFPLIAVEHENGNLVSRNGELPDPRVHCIEWAFWKVLTMSAHLAVCVAYPWGRTDEEKRTALTVFEKMACGFRDTYERHPRVLLMLGWWDENAYAKPLSDLYESYVFTKAGKFELLRD